MDWPRKILILPLVVLSLYAVQAQTNQPTSNQPPVIDDTVPPPSNNYPLGPDSLPNPSIPAGKTFKFEMSDSRIFPGTVRTITVYVPAAYKGDKPACLYVGLDGLGFDAPIVFDNLIAQHAMPVTIGIGLAPGTVESAHPPENSRFDRSFEFDSRSDLLARFLLEEVIPEVERHRTPNSLPILLSSDPNDRAIGGGSTGGIGAFTVAWERPDSFHRVFSAIGTFVGMRGGEQYYVLVRKTEPKPLRIFMQDGVHDEWPGGPEMGDWWMSNQTMNRALEFAGYDVRHVWGAGTHNGNQATALFPDAMRWLWRDWPSPIHTGESENPALKAILEPGETWQVERQDAQGIVSLAADSGGRVYYAGEAGNRNAPVLCALADAGCRAAGEPSALAFGPDGRAYAARAQGGLTVAVAHNAAQPSSAKPHIVAGNLRFEDFVVRSNGDIYATIQTANDGSELWLLRANGEEIRLDQNLKAASGIALSPDGLWLLVAQRLSHIGLSYRVRPDGTVDARAPFYDFYVPAWADDSGAAQVAMDRDGRAYVATRMGIQVFDRNGRVTAILPLPGNMAATGLCFGGKDFDTLYVAAGSKVYRRQLRVAGAPPWLSPFKLPQWNAG